MSFILYLVFSRYQKSGERERMGKVYDDWERLVEAVLRREKLRQLCYAHSVASSDSSSVLDHDFLHLHAKMNMARLQEELIYTLTQNKQFFEHGCMSPPTCESTDTSPRLSISSESEDCLVDLLDPDTIPQIKAIADTFFASNYGHEFCEVFVRFGKAAFGVYLTILDVEELNSSEDFGQLQWEFWNSTFKKWHLVIKKFINLYLCKAKLVFDQVLGEYGDASSTTLMEASEPSLMLLFNLGRSVAIAPDQTERMFCLLDMYKDLVELVPSVEALFPNEIGSSICAELHKLLTWLEDHAKAIFMGLRNTITHTPPLVPSPNGDVHALSKYVVNYIICLENYDSALNLILKEEDCGDLDAGIYQSILAFHLHSTMSALEAKITNMSDLYDDTSLKHIFMINNINYMVARIKSSRMKAYFGFEWIKRLTMIYRINALSYQRSTWSSIMTLLNIDPETDRATAKARLRDFNVAFKHIHENQTKWVVPNRQPRQELRVSASIVIVNAYRTFVGRISYGRLRVKHIKYTPDELETLILDLFEGPYSIMRHTPSSLTLLDLRM